MTRAPTSEDYAQAALLAVRMTLNLLPETRLTILIDHAASSPDYPVGLFSEVPIDRLTNLVAAVKAGSEDARNQSLTAIQKAMSHG